MATEDDKQNSDEEAEPLIESAFEGIEPPVGWSEAEPESEEDRDFCFVIEDRQGVGREVTEEEFYEYQEDPDFRERLLDSWEREDEESG